jgi:hypothetical protein
MIEPWDRLLNPVPLNNGMRLRALRAAADAGPVGRT